MKKLWKQKKLELKKEVIASLNRSMMAEVMGAEQLQRRREEERQREGRKNQKRDTPRPPCLRNPVRLEALRSEKRENVRQSFIVPDPRFEEL